ncbi:ORC-CDC6 family AAA ATPase [Hymenobacter terricola]|uniref:ORC-CDC6 family AAA ATPase n=1 Tax=Hymenobacter terricola TaxID=2819236 RepID=UPI001B315E73|nr:hypothetical protein [Hymenobacter terricola]
MSDLSPAPIKQLASAPPSVQEQLTHLFAHKAEWLNQELYDLFHSPGYFPELKRNQSCVLIGGRGTGKTTVLRGLSYEGQSKITSKEVASLEFIGIYYKVDSNRVSALMGLGLSDEQWQRPFAHYINLVVCSLILKMLSWYEQQPHNTVLRLHDAAWQRFQESLAIAQPASPLPGTALTVEELSHVVELAITRFEVYVNNILDEQVAKPTFSMLGAPLDSLMSALNTLSPFQGKPLFLLLDEYENFANYQQQIVNTLIKQSAGRNYCFKIGVRELGWRVKHTLNGQELRAPSDFRRISISDNMSGAKFRKFAETVCNRRLAKLQVSMDGKLTVKRLLPGPTNLEEANLLGINPLVKKILNTSASSFSEAEQARLHALPPMLVWFAHEWETRKGASGKLALTDLLNKGEKWEKRFDNYIYASLFAIREGKSGIRKHYAGWETYVLMAGGNIRFLLQLVEAAIRLQVQATDSLDKIVSYEHQTQAAIMIGSSNLLELEGVDVKGGKIMKMLQGLGRVFQIFADDPFGRAPEVNQFSVPELNGELHGTAAEVVPVQELLESAFSYLALQRAPSNKLSKEASRGFDYSIHPIYSAYFRFSHRRKRKTLLYASEILGLINNQKTTSDEIIARTKKAKQDAQSVLPPKEKPSQTGQLPLFSSSTI